ncbi:MAG: hypothetical protein H7323_07925 [Frankiales bacterium]|nr:hypothetical protein [Frankiales bacterium]
MSELTTGDWARYAGLVALASLVFLVVLGNRDGALVSLLAVYLATGTAGAVWLRLRRERS